MPRKTSAMMMPTSSASCCSFLGTLKLAMMIKKMNRLSIDKLYSVSQPAKNCRPKSPPFSGTSWWTATQMPNATARPM